MASLVLGVVGATVGFMMGGPAGAQAGWMVGSAIGGLINPAKGTNTEGPRLGDTRVQISTYGKSIPIIYGTVRTAGNIIWAAPFKETAHKNKSGGGKGGSGGSSSTTYTYSCSFALSLCANEIDGIARMWVDGKLIYNAAATDLVTAEASAKIRAIITIYQGTETQLPSPILQSFLGSTNVPAYRGQAYIVFDDMQLADYGNRIPNIEVEVIASGILTSNSNVLTTTLPGTFHGTTPRPFVQQFHVESIDDITLYQGQQTFIETNEVKIFKYSYGIEIYQGTILARSKNFWNVGYSDIPGFLNNNGDNYYWESNTVQLKFNAPIGISAGSLQFHKVGSIFYCTPNFGITTNNNIYKCYAIPSTTTTIEVTNWIAVDVGSLGGNRLYYYSGNIYAIHYDPTNSRFQLIILDDISFNITSIINLTIPFTAGIAQHELYINDSGIYFMYGSSLYKINVDGTHVQIFTTTSFIGATDSLNNLFVTDNGKTVLLTNYPNTTTHTTQSVMFYEGISDLGGTTTVSSIISDICARSHVSAYNTIELNNDYCDGFIITNQSTGRAALELIQKAYYFDAVTIDSVLVFIKRGLNNTITVIAEDKLSADDTGTETLLNTIENSRIDELELPKVVNISYYNKDNAYLHNIQSAKRQVTQSKNILDIELPICISDTKAKQIAEVSMYTTWGARQTIKISLSPEYLYLTSGDIISVTKNNTNIVYTVLLINSNERVSGITDWECILYDSSIYTQDVVASSPLVIASTIIDPIGGPAKNVLLDIPLLDSADTIPGFYSATCGYTGFTWMGAEILKSADNTNFTSIDIVEVPGATIGETTTVLGDFLGGFRVDELNTVTVTLTSGELASVTYNLFLAGNNIAVIGKEIIQFRNAELISANTYILSGLIRGLLGTEQYISTHTIGESFVELDMSIVQKIGSDMSEINIPIYYKVVSVGELYSSVSSTAFTNTGALTKPLSPVQIGGGRASNGDITIKWVRRVRGATLWSSLSDLPLNETTESYSIDIMSGTTVKRTLTSTTPTVVYTTANQVTDFGSNQASLLVNVYQISSTIGRGFVGVATI